MAGKGYTPSWVGTFWDDVLREGNYNARAYIPGQGWAPARVVDGKTITQGLPVGSLVEAAGGIYRIDRVNEDGSYVGSAYTPAPGEMDKLNGSANYWTQLNNSVVAGHEAAMREYEMLKRYGGSDLGRYLETMYDAAREQQLAALERAYAQNLRDAELQAAASEDYYRRAKERRVSDSEIANAALNESLAASGLNTGAGAQVKLAQANELQGSLGALESERTARAAELDDRRAALTREYRQRVAEAIAANQLELASRLYEEARRMDANAIKYAANAEEPRLGTAFQGGYLGTREFNGPDDYGLLDYWKHRIPTPEPVPPYKATTEAVRKPTKPARSEAVYLN